MASLNTEYLIYFLVLAVVILLYFQIADKFNIVDKPNYRSSHNKITIRGGGIIFPISLLMLSLGGGGSYPFFTSGLMIICTISFVDDLYPLSNKIRLFTHLVSVTLLFTELQLLQYPIWSLILMYIVVIGIINAYNFMDGINGICGGYTFVIVATLYYLNAKIAFVSPEWLIIVLIALMIFNYFNFRKIAKCFAGDVGSVGLAFIVIFFLGQLILKTGEIKYIGFLSLYGLDTITTIVFRLIKHENIFKAHRFHFYQYIVNIKKKSHVAVSFSYALVQSVLNILIIYLNLTSLGTLIFFVTSGLIFIAMRFYIEGRAHLLVKTVN